MICIMMNLMNYVKNHGKKIIIIFILIDLKREIKENIVFVMKAKKHIYKQRTRSDETFLKNNQKHGYIQLHVYSLQKYEYDYIFKCIKCNIHLKIEKIYKI